MENSTGRSLDHNKSICSSSGDDAKSLVAAAREGSSEALGQLLAGCQNYLLCIANRGLDDDIRAKIGASDVVQDTFVQAQQILDRFHGQSEEELLAWLACILEHKLHHIRRLYRQTQRRDIAREVVLENGQHQSAAPAPIEAAGQRPSAVAMQSEAAARLQRALERLPNEQRQVIALRDWDGRSFEQIALQLNCSYEAARRLWARAILSLQRQLGSDYHGNESA